MQEDKLGEFIMKDFTVLAPMGGRFKGRIALHSVKVPSLESAKAWASQRFYPHTKWVIILDEDYPDLYSDELRSDESGEHLSKRIKEIYDSLIK